MNMHQTISKGKSKKVKTTGQGLAYNILQIFLVISSNL